MMADPHRGSRLVTIITTVSAPSPREMEDASLISQSEMEVSNQENQTPNLNQISEPEQKLNSPARSRKRKPAGAYFESSDDDDGDLDEEAILDRLEASAGANNTPRNPRFGSLLVLHKKTGKLTSFVEKKLNLEMHPQTYKELAEFFEYQSALKEPMTEFPVQFYPLLAKLVEESDSTLMGLGPRIKAKLMPVGFMDTGEQDRLSVSVVNAAIQLMATRQNYGIQDMESNQGALWRWEANDLSWFPESIRATIESRRAERAQIREQVNAQFQELSDADKEELLSNRRKRRAGDDLATPVAKKLGTAGSAKRGTPDPEVERRKQEEKERKERERLEKEEAKRLEKEAKEAARLAAQKEREDAKRAALEAKEAAKKAAQEAKEAAKKAIQDAKDAAKKAKDEAREQAARKKEEERQKAEQAQKRILGFFSAVPKDSPKRTVTQELSDFELAFPQFHLKAHARLAPRQPVGASINNEALTVILREPLSEHVLAETKRRWKQMKSTKINGYRLGNIEDELAAQIKSATVKLLQFQENYRPPYFGTWNRQTEVIRPTLSKFLAKDSNVFDYEIESDDEWEEEEEGDECLSDEEDDDESDDGLVAEEEDEEDGWLVPHGYLSDDEGIDEDAKPISKTEGANSSSQADGKNIKKKAEPLVPIIVGPTYQVEAYVCASALLEGYEIRPLVTVQFPVDPLAPIADLPEESLNTPAKQMIDGESVCTLNRSKSRGSKPRVFPEECLDGLKEIFLGTSKGIDKICDEFRAKYGEDKVAKARLQSKIREIAVREKRPGDLRAVWHPMTGSSTSNPSSSVPASLSKSKDGTSSFSETPCKPITSFLTIAIPPLSVPCAGKDLSGPSTGKDLASIAGPEAELKPSESNLNSDLPSAEKDLAQITGQDAELKPCESSLNPDLPSMEMDLHEPKAESSPSESNLNSDMPSHVNNSQACSSDN